MAYLPTHLPPSVGGEPRPSAQPRCCRRRSPAARWHEHNLAEGSYALLLAVVVALLLYITFAAEHKIDARPEPGPPIGTLPGRDSER